MIQKEKCGQLLLATFGKWSNFSVPFRALLVQSHKNPTVNLQGFLCLQRVNRKIKARARYQYSAGVSSPGRSATRSHVLSRNVSFSPDTQQGPDKLTQVCWFQGCLIRNSKPRIWAASAEAQARLWMLCELCLR